MTQTMDLTTAPTGAPPGSNLSMKPVTKWYRVDPQGQQATFNHLEDGHVPATQPRPTPKCPQHASVWGRGQWQAQHAWLTAALPPQIVYFAPHNKEG